MEELTWDDIFKHYKVYLEKLREENSQYKGDTFVEWLMKTYKPPQLIK